MKSIQQKSWLLPVGLISLFASNVALAQSPPGDGAAQKQPLPGVVVRPTARPLPEEKTVILQGGSNAKIHELPTQARIPALPAAPKQEEARDVSSTMDLSIALKDATWVFYTVKNSKAKTGFERLGIRIPKGSNIIREFLQTFALRAPLRMAALKARGNRADQPLFNAASYEFYQNNNRIALINLYQEGGAVEFIYKPHRINNKHEEWKGYVKAPEGILAFENRVLDQAYLQQSRLLNFLKRPSSGKQAK